MLRPCPQMVLQELVSYADGVDGPAILQLAALATRWKEPPKDALDTLVLNASVLDRAALDEHEQLEFTPFDPKRKRTEATLKAADGTQFDVIKGAPNVVMGLCSESTRVPIQAAFDGKVLELANRGIRSLAVAREDEGDTRGMRMLGLCVRRRVTKERRPSPDRRTCGQARAARLRGGMRRSSWRHRAFGRRSRRCSDHTGSVGRGARWESIPVLVPRPRRQRARAAARQRPELWCAVTCGPASHPGRCCRYKLLKRRHNLTHELNCWRQALPPGV